MSSKTMRTIGWVMSGVLSAFLILASASGKFLEWEGKAEMFDQLGYSTEVMTKIGVVEVILAVLILIPRTSFIGALLLTGYLGGATATHVRVGDAFFMPIVIGVFLWIAIGLRRPEVFALAFGSPPATRE